MNVFRILCISCYYEVDFFSTPFFSVFSTDYCTVSSGLLANNINKNLKEPFIIFYVKRKELLTGVNH